jgi:preprotein translocase subunit YajC
MNKVHQVTGTKQKKPGFGNLLLIINFLVIVMIFGCKKQDTALQKESTSQDLTSADVSNIKADITVHAGSSIQAAVDAAQPGYIIKIEPGTYNEAVHVEKANIKIIGLSHTGTDIIIQNPW